MGNIMLSSNHSLATFQSSGIQRISSILLRNNNLFLLTSESITLLLLCIGGALVSTLLPINIEPNTIHTLPSAKIFFVLAENVIRKLQNLSNLFFTV